MTNKLSTQLISEVRAGKHDGQVAYVYSEYDKSIRKVVGGELGYYPITRVCDQFTVLDPNELSKEAYVDAQNNLIGVSPELADAIMLVSMFPNK